MSTYSQNIKSNYTQILILIIGILTITSWVFLIVPELKNDFSAFQQVKEHIGKDTYVEYIGGELSPPHNSKDFTEYYVVNVDGDILEIKSTYTSRDLVTGQIVYDRTSTYFVDQTTRKHVGNEGWYFIFPLNVQKQNYSLLDPNMEVPATFVFEETKYIDGLEVYVFSCESFGDDLSDGFAEFAPTKIYADQTCKASIEPITGKNVEFAITWDIYTIQDGSRLPVEVGGAETTVFSEQILLQSAKETKQLFSVYDSVIPIFLLITIGGVFSTSVVLKKSKEKTKAVTEAQKKIDMDEKLAKEKEEFVARITHDLKQPLVPILGNVDLLELPEMGELNEMQKESVAEIHNRTNLLLSMIENLISAQKIGSGAMKFDSEELSSKTILKDCLKTHTPIMNDKNIEFFDSSTIDIKIKGDEKRIQQTLTNLVQNAHDFAPENGKIEIGVNDGEKEVTFFVKDNGEGIPKEKHDKLFKKYGQVKSKASRQYGGTGLGLVVSKELVEGMKGKIWLESEVGKGTTFFFTLPKAE